MPIKRYEQKEARSVRILGKIKMGTKMISKKGNEYPAETSEFVLNPIEEVLDKFGNPQKDRHGKILVRENPDIVALINHLGTDKPQELKVVFHSANPEQICPQYLTWWAGNGTQNCKGNGEWAYYKGKEQVNGLDVPQYPRVPKEYTYQFKNGFNRKCLDLQCPQSQPQGGKPPLCKPEMRLKFFIPELTMFGAYQIITSSFQAIEAVNNCLALAENALRLQGIPSISGVPMRLWRKRTTNSHGGVNYILQLDADVPQLELEKQKFLNRQTSTLGIGVENFQVADSFMDVPDYDLLPQSEHGRLQTGDDPKALEAPIVLPPADTLEDWLNDESIVEKFNALGALKNVPVTKAKMKATAKNHDSKESLIKYLDEQLAVGS